MKKTLSTLALATGISLSALPAAMAIDNSNFATNTEQAQTVASFQVTKEGDPGGDCTATAISSRWVMTAHHCVQEATEFGGKLRFGQEGNYRHYEVDYWESAQDGSDLALVHTSQPIELDHYSEIDSKQMAAGEGTLYGWSVDGMGKTGKLPEAKLNITQQEIDEAGLGKDSSQSDSGVLFTTVSGQTIVQGGDSGGPLFQNGKIVAVLTGSTSDTPGAQAVLTPVAGHDSWVQQRIAQDPSDQEKTQQLEEIKKIQETLRAMEDEEGAVEDTPAESSQSTGEAGQAASSTGDSSSTPWIVGGIVSVLVVVGSFVIVRLRRQK